MSVNLQPPAYQIRSKWSNQITRAKYCLNRAVQRESANGSELIESIDIKTTLRRPQMLQANQSAWLDI